MTQELTFEAAFAQLHGYDPTRLYCIATGKPIGVLDSAEVYALIQDIGDMPMTDLCDEYSIRLLASLRPSIRWNKMREETLDQMRTRAPVETLAYLTNRLIATPESKRQTFEDRLWDYAERIKMFTRLSLMQADVVTRCVNMLIELDACTNLDSLVCEMTHESFSEAALIAIHKVEMKLHAERVKKAQEQNSWHAAGSPLSRQAYANVKRETAPPTKTQVVKAEKRAESRFFDNLFEELATVAPSAPKPVSARVNLPVIKLGALKLNIAKKG